MEIFPAYINAYQLLTSVNTNFASPPTPAVYRPHPNIATSGREAFFSQSTTFFYIYLLICYVYFLGRKIKSLSFNSLLP